ncbi:MAG TPA: tRNA (N(6)-L-threonylcarbamoyladenosine(37)-C(2))-methylthiotransferase MtaB [Candidatus Binataceae bacterium]|nr:tRNA (N(6)-L-threonylcarbamoyladenosine(37)-C(2))-methylthiotransferase MtaB [Candidatus Binataceae bacterium]
MRFAIATLGCKVNQYDSAVIEARLAARGAERGEFDSVADVYVINTCTITDRADTESLKLARRARRLNPGARVVMTGCLAQANPTRLATAPEVDAIVGLGRAEDLDRAILEGSTERVMVSNLRKVRAPIEIAGVTLAGHTRAFLKLQEGCDQFCAFCIVPTSRGISRSVEPRRVLAAIDELHGCGRKEVVLSGVHLGGYGKDLSPPASLVTLLEMIAERSPIRRVRLSSLDPEELGDEIIDLFAASDAFCPHLHLPLQSGVDQTLAAMRRRYDTAFYRGRVERVLELLPEAALGTDLIVGFPGESAADFKRYFKFVESLPLAYFHVFPYSVRAGTTAAKLDGRVAAGEIRRRAQAMRELGEQRRSHFASRFVDAKLRVLLEERAEDGRLTGLSRNYIRVTARGSDELRNHEVEFQASHVHGATLAGEIVGLAGGRAAAGL